MMWTAARCCRSRRRISALLAITAAGGVLVSGCVAGPKNFKITEASPGIFIGAEPTSKADFDRLRERGVRTILNLQCLPWIVRADRRRALAEGMKFRHVFIPAWPLQPSERRVKEAVLTLRDPSLRPIYVHCYLGHDRTALIMGLYRIYYEGWSPDAAWAEALRGGFKVRWVLQGLRNYFWRHSDKPDWVQFSEEADSARESVK